MRRRSLPPKKNEEGMGRTSGFAAALLAILCLWPGSHVRADAWPSRPVKIVVAFAPGGSADQFGRLLAGELSVAFKQQFFVENRPGNSGAIGSAQVARAEPDGYTLLIGGSGPHLTGPAINPNIGYEPLKDFTHIAMIGADSYALAANPALGVKSIAELVALAKSRKEPITSSSPGPGSLGHLLIEQFKRKSNIDIQHVPAPNSGVTDVLGNHISMTLTAMMTVGEQVKAGKLWALAVTSTDRNPIFRDIPTFAEQGYPDVRGDTWFWLTAPKNLPPAIVSKLSDATRRIVQSPKIQQHFQKLAVLTKDLDPAAVQKFIADEYAFGRRSPRRPG
jgi:tripartite-type tricarboxylate transporter receptor subunit TctC